MQPRDYKRAIPRNDVYNIFLFLPFFLHVVFTPRAAACVLRGRKYKDVIFSKYFRTNSTQNSARGLCANYLKRDIFQARRGRRREENLRSPRAVIQSLPLIYPIYFCSNTSTVKRLNIFTSHLDAPPRGEFEQLRDISSIPVIP